MSITQEEFDKKFENTIKKNGFTWKIIKNISNKYPDEFDNYAARHSRTLVIRETSPCDGCKWNDGIPHSACYSCND